MRAGLRIVLCGLLGIAALQAAPASAATTCTATTSALAFPAAGPSQVDSAATITITCNTFGLTALATVRVRMCLHLDGGSLAPTQTTPRRMRNGFGDPLDFQIYRDPARALIWGSSATAATPTPVLLDLQYDAPLLGGSGTATTTLYGRIPAQAGLASGSFSASFGAANAVLNYRYAEALLLTPPWPTSCTAGGTSGATTGFPFTATAAVASQCVITTANNLEFGTVPGFIAANRDQTATIAFTCTGRTAWNVGLDDGLHATGGTRRMRQGNSDRYVTYQLFRNPGRSQRWGTTAGVDTASGVGSGATQSVIVHGRVPGPQTAPAGTYGDTVTVTVTY